VTGILLVVSIVLVLAAAAALVGGAPVTALALGVVALFTTAGMIRSGRTR
jgi:hypothetical protein